MTKETEGSLALQSSSRVVAEMNEELRAAYDKICDRLRKAAANDVLARFEVGTVVASVMQNESKYGAGAADKLADALGITKAVLYTHQQVAVSWKRQELRDLADRVDEATGYHLDWTHICALTPLTSLQKRDELIECCFEDKLTSREIRALVVGESGARSNNPKGRPRSAPKSPSAGLSQLRKLTNSLVNAQDVFDEAVFDRLVEDPSEFANDSILEQLREAQEDQERLEAVAKTNRLKLQAALEAVEKAMSYADESDEEDEVADVLPVSETVGDEFLPKRKKAATEDSPKARAAAAVARLKSKKVGAA
jgi:hypothetical protein